MRFSSLYKMLLKPLLLIALSIAFSDVYAQGDEVKYSVKNGSMYVHVKKKIKHSDLEDFIRRFDLNHLGLKNLLLRGLADSLKMAGWTIEKNSKDELVIFKPLISSEDLMNPGEFIVFTGQHPPYDAMFPSVSSSVFYGFNQFRNKKSFLIQDSLVRFYLKGNSKAQNVMLAGSFNTWDPQALQMKKTDTGWIADVKLKPGKYWYKFIVDGNWVIDNDNIHNENDDLGNTNSVFYYTNHVFNLPGYQNARNVSVSGSFNNWVENELPLKKTANGWQLPVYLAEGTHTYRFVVDGKWISDPSNPVSLPNEFNETNSVISLGNPHIFRLDGFTNAGEVVLSGSFNGWRKNELFMKKTATGWELPYVMAAGNYEYQFLVDGKPVADPLVSKNSKGNSELIINPNYTFQLTGFENAEAVFLAGDFNNWDRSSLKMKKQNGVWSIHVHLSPGKHLYKFIVDGKWILDPKNTLWEQNEHNTGNSVLWFDK